MRGTREVETLKIRNIFGNVYKGQIGKSLVAESWHGHDYIRAYRKPRASDSPLLAEERHIYGEAVGAWNSLCDRQKELYRRLAEAMSGYNLFVQRYIDTVRAGKNPEVPIPRTYVTADGQPVPGGDLIVRTRDRTLFTDGLDDGRGEVALTAFDAPYTITLRKGTREETVLTLPDVLEVDIPVVLESVALGIRLVLDVAKPGPGAA